MNPDQEMLTTIEEIRKEKFGEIPAELVREIISIETNFTDNRQEAFKRIAEAIEIHLNKEPVAQKKVG